MLRDCPYLWATAKANRAALSKDLLFYLNEDRMSLEAIQGNIWREENITFNGEYGQAFRLINKDPKK